MTIVGSPLRSPIAVVPAPILIQPSCDPFGRNVNEADTNHHDDKQPKHAPLRITSRVGCYLSHDYDLLDEIYVYRDVPSRMNTPSGMDDPPSPPHPALTKALTPAFLTASNIVSIKGSYC